VSRTPFQQKVLIAMLPTLTAWGFRHSKPLYFARGDGPWAHMLFPDLLRFTRDTFTVSYGLTFPALEAELANATGKPQGPGLAVANELRRQYHFAAPHSVPEAVAQALADLEREALPWFAAVRTFHDALDAFHQQRIEPRLASSTPDPRGWALYGLLLVQAGESAAATAWLSRAADDLRKQWYSLSGKLTRERQPGARIIRADPFDVSLLQLVDRRLSGVVSGLTRE